MKKVNKDTRYGEKCFVEAYSTRFFYSLSFRHCACASFLFVLKSACRIRQALCLVFKAKLNFFFPLLSFFLFYLSFLANDA